MNTTKFVLKIITIAGTLIAALATGTSQAIELNETIEAKKKNSVKSSEDTTEKEEEA